MSRRARPFAAGALAIRGALGLLALGLALVACGEEAPTGAPAAPHAVDIEVGVGPYERKHFYLERDRFLPADGPRMVKPDDAAHVLPEDEVFGVVVGGEARAYPVTMLSYHHVVNDVIQGIPVAITY